MAGFLAPTRRKLRWTALVLMVLPASFLLRTIPHPWDVLDLRLLGGQILFLLLGVPIRLLDALTDSAFAQKGEGFLRFPSATQVAFALCADLLLFYVVACVIVRCRERRDRGNVARGPSGPPPS
jgi:hypothetical protein